MDTNALNVLMGGFIGAVFGGAVSLLGVWVTLRHDAEKELRGRRVQAAADAVVVLEAFRGSIETNGPSDPRTIAAYDEISTRMLILQMFVAESGQILFVTVIDGLMEQLTATAARTGRFDPSSAAFHDAAEHIALAANVAVGVIVRWLTDPSAYKPRRGRKVTAKSIIADMRAERAADIASERQRLGRASGPR